MAIDVKEMNRIARLFVEDVNQVMPLDKAVLFGSYAKGNATDASDMDICFFLKDYNGKQRVEIIAELIGMGGKYTDVAFEPLVFESSELYNNNPFIREILTSGVELL